MTDRLNPFPDYTVVRLRDDPGLIVGPTIPTEAIINARELIKAYFERLSKERAPTESNALIVAVRGDFGTGKTHLLLDVAKQVKDSCSKGPRVPTILRLTCKETDPSTWFKGTIGPELNQPFLSDIITSLYADAGRIIAEKTMLTEAAAAKLSQSPKAIYELIKNDLLSATAVEQQFDTSLNLMTQYATDSVRKALLGLVWAETEDISRRWVSGQKLTRAELVQLRVPDSLSTDEDAAGVLIALAAIHSYFRWPFVVLIDELEHLTRHDLRLGTKRNIIWLKRLLEGLGVYSTLVFVAGHWSAWEAQGDYQDRFTQIKQIDMLKLTASEVKKIVEARVQPLPTNVFGSEQAATIAECGKGNMRRILSLCRALFRESEGFVHAIDRDKIREVAGRLGHRMSLEEANLRVQEVLETKGFEVFREAKIDNISFDLIAYRDKEPQMVIEFKHAVHQGNMYDDARKFIEQIRLLGERRRSITGCFFADGNIDDQLLGILQSAPQLRVLWYDLSQRDAIEKFSAEQSSSGTSKIGTGEADRLNGLLKEREKLLNEIASSKESDDARLTQHLEHQRAAIQKEIADFRSQVALGTQDLEQKLADLEKKRAQEIEELYSRLAREVGGLTSQRDATLLSSTDEELSPKFHATYQEVSRQPLFVEKIRLSGQAVIQAVMFAVMGIALIFGANAVSRLIAATQDMYIIVNLTAYVFGVGLVLAAGLVFWATLSEIDRYFDYSTRLLRELYVRSSNPGDLIRADTILRNSLDEFGPREGRRKSGSLLAREFPVVFQYLQGDDNRPRPA